MPFQPTPPVVNAGAIDTALETIIANLTAININLTKPERGSANSIDDDRLGFVTDYYENKGDYPTMLPGFMNESDADAHNALREELLDTVNKANTVVELLTDIQINSEHFTMEYGLEGYNVVGRAKDKNVPGADTFYDLLSRHFDGQGNFGDPGPEPTP